MARTVKLSDVIPSRFAHLTPANEENIERIRADLVDGCKMLLNEPHAFREGERWELLAGHDRIEAARRAGWTEVQIRDFSGAVNTDDAILAHFCKENLLRKDVSKAAVAGEWLRKHPDWSDGKIAAESGCSREHVSVTRAEMGVANPQVLASSRTGLDGKTREYKPRTVRTAVPSKRGIPHPTKVQHESAEEIAAALTRRTPRSEAPELREAEASEPATGSSAITPEVGAPTGAPASDDGRTRFSVVAEVVARLDAPPVVPPAEHRLAFHVLTREQIENARAWHRFLGTLLLQLEIERKDKEAA